MYIFILLPPPWRHLTRAYPATDHQSYPAHTKIIGLQVIVLLTLRFQDSSRKWQVKYSQAFFQKCFYPGTGVRALEKRT
jgi:hypothetical protein